MGVYAYLGAWAAAFRCNHRRVRRHVRETRLDLLLWAASATAPRESSPVDDERVRARTPGRADQTWEDFLLTLEDYCIAPALQADLKRQLRTERVVSGAEREAEFEQRGRRRGRS